MKLSRKRFDCLVMIAILVILFVTAPVSGQTPGAGSPPAAAGQPPSKATGGVPGLGNTSPYFPGFNGTFGGAFPSSSRIVASDKIMISWSKNHDELRGFSHKTGEWTALKIVKQKEIIPVVSENVAAVSLGSSMAAFSGETGTWDVLKLRKGSKAVPIVSNTLVQTTDNDYLYTFAASKGKWTSPNDPKFLPARRVVAPLSRFLPGYSGTPPQFDQQALRLARHFKGKGLDNKEGRTEITKAVSQAFDQRQAHQKAEAARLQEKLKKIQAAISSRESLRRRIIARRVDELLDPSIEWDEQSPNLPALRR